jgi:Fe-S-cluster-containing hydrogenase component 2
MPGYTDHGRSAVRIVSPAHQEIYRALRQYPLFDGLANDDLVHAITSGELEIRRFWRDDLIADGRQLEREGGRIFLVKRGQIAVAIFPAHVLEAERRWAHETSDEDKHKKVRSQGPLIRLAEKNIATFGEGDLFNSEAIPAADLDRCAFYCVEPAETIVVSKPRMAALTARFPFFAQRLRRAVDLARSRLSGIKGLKQEIFDFYVRHGLSVAETLRVRQVDRCIECKECERACEERYGHKRLSIFGPRLGMLDFVYTCRSCTDQRCIDPCNYDSIRFDQRTKEIVINETTCTGCAACAVACPYGSIEMVDIEDPSKRGLKLRLNASGSLQFGEGTGRKARLEKIASKCDHCMNFSDQACIAHCPTGALIEIKPTDVFKDKLDVSKQAARSGYEHTVFVNVSDMLQADLFKKGLGIRDFADSKVKRGRASPVFIWGLGLLAFFAALTEIVLRLWRPVWSLQYRLFRLEGLEQTIAELKVNYRPGCELAVWLGYVGTALLLIAMLYPLRKRFRLLQKLSTSASWFDFHVMGGVVGPLMIILHSAMKLDNWVSFGFWSMILVVASGLMGRYLYVQVPELLHGQELEELEHERALARIRQTNPDAVAMIDDEVEEYRDRVGSLAQGASAVTVFLWVIADDFGRPVRFFRRRIALATTSATGKIRSELVHHAGELMLVERRRLLIPRLQSVLQTWRLVHVPFSFVMIAISIVHIAVALTYSM